MSMGPVGVRTVVLTLYSTVHRTLYGTMAVRPLVALETGILSLYGTAYGTMYDILRVSWLPCLEE